MPISARPNTRRYLAEKFIGRNKIAVVAAILLLITLIAGLGVSLWQADQAREERDRAEKRFRDVRQLSNSLLFEISPKIERLPGSIEARELLVTRALEYLDSLAAESRSDESLQGELASAYEKIGDLQGNVERPNLSDYAGAINSFEKSRAIRNSLPADRDNLLALAQNFRTASSIRNRQSDVTGALADAEKARGLYSDMLQTDSSEDTRLAAAEAQMDYGQIYSLNNQYSSAIPKFAEAIDSLAKLDQTNIKTRRLSAKANAYLANAQSWDGQQTIGEEAIQRAIAIVETVSDDSPRDTDAGSTAWQVYMIASSIYDGQHKAIEMAEKGLSAAKHSLELDKADQQAKHNFARSSSALGIAFAKMGKVDQAITYLRSAEASINELIEREPKNTGYQRDLAVVYVRMGDTLEKTRNFAAALQKYRESATVFEQLSTADVNNTRASRDLAQSLRSVAKMEIALSQKQEARSVLLRAKAILDTLRQSNSLGAYDQQLIDDVDKTLASI